MPHSAFGHSRFDRAVARATGEDVPFIAGCGFSPFDPEDDGRRPPLVVDWDELERARNVPLFEQRSRR